MSNELGKKSPCFGEFRCSRCNKKWQSSQAWADYGQQCKHCATNIEWKWAYGTEGLQCDKCKSSTLVRPLDQRNYQDREFIRAHRLEDVDYADDENYIDPAKEHRQDLCEKCLRIGRSCRETAGQECRQRTNWVPQSTTSSSTPYRAFLTLPESTTSSLASYQASFAVPPSTTTSSSTSYRTSAKFSLSIKPSNSSGRMILVLLGIVFLALVFYWYQAQ